MCAKITAGVTASGRTVHEEEGIREKRVWRDKGSSLRTRVQRKHEENCGARSFVRAAIALAVGEEDRRKENGGGKAGEWDPIAVRERGKKGRWAGAGRTDQSEKNKKAREDGFRPNAKKKIFI